MDTAQWPQGIGIVEPNDQNSSRVVVEKKPRPQKEQALNCPRCNSTNTKFCYYNNYSLSQPRYFCKTCRRYWTEGGSLRSVPVGGGSRKNKRSSSSLSSSSSSSSKKHIVVPDLVNPPPNFSSPNPKIHVQGQDLNLAYNPPHHHYINGFVSQQNPNHDPTSSNSSLMDLLKNGNMISSMYNTSSSGYNGNLQVPHVHDHFKTSLGFSLDGLENNDGYNGNLQGVQDHHTNNNNNNDNPSSRILFPFEELKPTNDHQVQQGESNGYWINGMLSGGSW
ncbi:hypothetical protein ACJIZ3_003548 [Penstemon smallii]|uniref:Dof zinc finger protein n=1 Tax=Penstemon smallii TaxID=265156 RepID=A0ABD3UCM4_9LAMI